MFLFAQRSACWGRMADAGQKTQAALDWLRQKRWSLISKQDCNFMFPPLRWANLLRCNFLAVDHYRWGTAHLSSRGKRAIAKQNNIPQLLEPVFIPYLPTCAAMAERRKGNIYEVRTFSWTKAIVARQGKQDSFHGNNEIHEQCFNSRRSNVMEWTDVKREQVGDWTSTLIIQPRENVRAPRRKVERHLN